MSKGKTIIIAGQTATGKTGLALEIAQSYNGALISADSRQVYKELSIGTGKNDTEGVNVPVYGIDQISVKETYSSALFVQSARTWIDEIHSQGKLAIVVGGTGFYIKSLIDPPETLAIPLNKELRENLENTSVDALQKILAEMNASRLDVMNNSDRNNPRRLVRAIEVEHYKKESGHKTEESYTAPEYCGLALHASQDYLTQKIASRVKEMMNSGYNDEVTELVQKFDWSTPGMQTIGYAEWEDFYDHKISHEEVTQKIIANHVQYARKQMIFLKHIPQLTWFDIETDGWREKAIEYCKNYIKNIP